VPRICMGYLIGVITTVIVITGVVVALGSTGPTGDQ
jgi:hypothetical protein